MLSFYRYSDNADSPASGATGIHKTAIAVPCLSTSLTCATSMPSRSGSWRGGSSAAASGRGGTTCAAMRVAGIGYATPYLGLFREEADRCLAFMPAAQGVVKWPSARPTLTALVDEAELPLVGRRRRPRADRPCAGNVARRRGAPARGVARAGRGRTASGGRTQPERPVGAHRHHAVRSRPALFALADHAAACARPGSRRPAGARRSMSRRFRAAGSCARRSPGSAPAPRCRRRSPGSTSSRRPSRSIARFRPGASGGTWCPNSSRCSRPRRAEPRGPVSADSVLG